MRAWDGVGRVRLISSSFLKSFSNRQADTCNEFLCSFYFIFTATAFYLSSSLVFAFLLSGVVYPYIPPICEIEIEIKIDIRR